MNSSFVSVIGKNFKSIQSNITKIVKIKDQEKLQKKFDDTRARQQSYKSRFQRPTQVKKISSKDNTSSLLSGLGGMFKALLAIIGIAGLFSILKSTGIGKYIGEFVSSALSAIVDIIQKAFKFIKDVLFDPEVLVSLQKLASSFFKFIGALIMSAASLASNLLRDNEVLETIKTTVVAVLKAVVEGIKASYAVISQLVVDNMDTIKQTAYDVFVEIKNALIISLQSVQNILAGGLDPRISSGLKEIFVESWNFIKELFTTEFKDSETGKSFTLGEKAAVWLLKLSALGLLWMVFKAKLYTMGKALSGVDLSKNCGSCMDMDFLDRDKKKLPSKKDIPKEKTVLEKIGEKAEKVKEKAKQVGQKVVQVVGETTEVIKKRAKQAWGTITKAGEKFYERASRLGSAAKDYLARGIKRFEGVFRAILKNPLIRDKALKAFGKKIGMTAIRSIATKLAAAAAGLLTGGVVTAIMLVLTAIDVVMLFYAFYEFMFVTTDGENEDGGFYKTIKAEVDKWIKENPETTPTPAMPALPSAPAQAAPAQAAPAQAAPAQAAPAAASAQASASSPTQMNASAPSSSPSPASDYPANWAASPMGVPAGVAVEKRQVSGLGYKGPRKRTDGVIIHHTGGRGLDTAIQTLQQRKLSYHYLVDRNGKVVQIVPDELRASHAGVTNKKPGFDNDNTVSISMVAKDDTDVTPEQIAAASSLEGMLAKKYGFAKTNAFGHGEVSSGKHPKEGFTIASAIRAGRVDQAIAGITEKSLEDIKQNTPPSITSQTMKKPGDVIDTASTQLNSGLRKLEDLFMSGRPSFNDLSTTVNQTNTISRPGGNVRNKEQESIQFLIQRQVS